MHYIKTDPRDLEDVDEVEAAQQRENAQAAHDYDTCKVFAREVMEEMGLLDPMNQHVVAVRGINPATPKSSIRLGFALYNNYQMDSKDRLDERATQRVRDAFGFKGDSMWFMDALETYWVYDD